MAFVLLLLALDGSCSLHLTYLPIPQPLGIDSRSQLLGEPRRPALPYRWWSSRFGESAGSRRSQSRESLQKYKRDTKAIPLLFFTPPPPTRSQLVPYLNFPVLNPIPFQHELQQH